MQHAFFRRLASYSVLSSFSFSVLASCKFITLRDASTASRGGQSPEISKQVAKRITQPGVKQSLMGALLYLDDMQIRSRPSKQSSFFDACGVQDGCIPVVHVNVPFLNRFVPLAVPIKISNEVGEWASTIDFLPVRLGDKDGESMTEIQDSNVFMTAAIAYPMFLISETSLPEEGKIVREMRKLALKNVRKYKRGATYNFWQERPGTTSSFPRTGPYNVPVTVVDMLAKAYVNPSLRGEWDSLGTDLDLPPRAWLNAILDKSVNKSGSDAAFNIPNDADDTSVAVAVQYLHAQEFVPNSGDAYYSQISNFVEDIDALNEFSKYRDQNRTREDGRDAWKGKNSGAFLTWLKSEDEGTFEHPETGVIPLALNNVDCVVNANVLFATGVTRTNNVAGISDAMRLLNRAAETGEWQRKCGLYYPQLMMFPYTLSRAFRDGNRVQSELRRGVSVLLPTLLEQQKDDGSFPGGKDKTFELSTALAVVSLLNIGVEVAREQGLEQNFHTAIERGIAYLVGSRQEYSLVHQDTFDRSRSHANEKRTGYRWKSGLFFSASFWDLAQWRSEAYTVSIVLEALSKYILAYDEGSVDIATGRRIVVDKYSVSAATANEEFLVRVE